MDNDSLNSYSEYINESIEKMNQYANYLNQSMKGEFNVNCEFFYKTSNEKNIYYNILNKNSMGVIQLKFEFSSPFFYKLPNDIICNINYYRGLSTDCDYKLEYSNFDLIKNGYNIIKRYNPIGDGSFEYDINFSGNGNHISVAIIPAKKGKYEIILPANHIGTPLLYIYEGFEINLEIFLNLFPRYSNYPIFLYPINDEFKNLYKDDKKWKKYHNMFHDWVIENDILSKIGEPKDYLYIGLDWEYLLLKKYMVAYKWVENYIYSDTLKKYLQNFGFSCGINNNPYISKYELTGVAFELLIWIYNSLVTTDTLLDFVNKKNMNIVKTIWDV